MARPFSLRHLAEVVVNDKFDAPTAAAYFGVTKEYIESQQGSAKYREYLKRIIRDNRQKETQLITKIAKDVEVSRPIEPAPVTYSSKLGSQ